MSIRFKEFTGNSYTTGYSCFSVNVSVKTSARFRWIVPGISDFIWFALTAGWTQIHGTHAKKTHFEHLIFRLGIPSINQVNYAKHFKTPIFHQLSRRFSYKIYDLEKVKETFSEQEAVNFKTSAAFRNSEEVGFERFYNTMEAVEAAKRRAFTRFTSSTQNQTPTSQSEIVISAGEGRATREMELIWWPNMFKQCQDFGKLTVRFLYQRQLLSDKMCVHVFRK